MPFRLKNTGMSFQCFMDRILGGLPYVLIYLDNILVASPDKKTHAVHLRAVLQALGEKGLVLNRGKCKFFRSEVEFLGLRVTASGVAPLPDQISAVADFPQPTTIKVLQAILGVVNFYHWFIPATAKILLPLKGCPQRLQEGGGAVTLVPTNAGRLQGHQDSPAAVGMPGLPPGQR